MQDQRSPSKLTARRSEPAHQRPERVDDAIADFRAERVIVVDERAARTRATSSSPRIRHARHHLYLKYTTGSSASP